MTFPTRSDPSFLWTWMMVERERRDWSRYFYDKLISRRSRSNSSHHCHESHSVLKMSLSSFFPAKFLPSSMNPRDRTSDSLSHLRFVLETLPGSRKYVFTPATRAEILSELYDAFWGPYAHLFLPNSNSSLPLHATLSQLQSSLGFCGAGKPEPIIPGRPCAHILKKGESCFRCK